MDCQELLEKLWGEIGKLAHAKEWEQGWVSKAGLSWGREGCLRLLAWGDSFGHFSSKEKWQNKLISHYKKNVNETYPLSESPLRTMVVIPAYNAASTLSTFLSDLLRYWPQQHILIVNDGSTDETTEVASSFSIVFLSHPQNYGKGEALKTGFRYAIDNGYDAVLTLDADGQHDPSLISRFLETQRLSHAEIVIGSRMVAPGGMPFLRWCSNTVTSKIVSWRAGCHIPDSQSGYRLILCSVLASLPLTTSHYETESEILIRAGRARFRIADTPIPVLYTGEPSFIHPFRDIRNFIALIAKSLFW